jgi:hypothetical protein
MLEPNIFANSLVSFKRHPLILSFEFWFYALRFAFFAKRNVLYTRDTNIKFDNMF